MTALDLLNVGLQTLLLGSAGCLLVWLFLNDARHRAWASLLSLAAMVLLPWMPLWQGAYSAWEAQDASTWRPEWKVDPLGADARAGQVSRCRDDDGAFHLELPPLDRRPRLDLGCGERMDGAQASLAHGSDSSVETAAAPSRDGKACRCG